MHEWERKYTVMKRILESANIAFALCDIIPEPYDAGCLLAKSYTLLKAEDMVAGGEQVYSVFKNLHSSMTESQEIEAKEEFDYIQHLYHRFKNFDEWSDKSLGIINKNMVKQHTEMRAQLQDRHEEMQNAIGHAIGNASTATANNLVEMSSYIAGDVACDIVKSLNGTMSHCSNRRKLKGYGGGNEVKEHELLFSAIEWPEEHVFRNGATLKNVEAKVNEMKVSQEEMKAEVDEMKGEVGEIKTSLDKIQAMLARLLD